MSQTAFCGEYSQRPEKLYLAIETGWRAWRLGFGVQLGGKLWEVSIGARDRGRLKEAIEQARVRFGVARARVISCYEAGRDGFWLDRFLRSCGIENLVVDSSSIEINRRARRAKTDCLDVRKLASMLMRYDAGEKRVWSVVRVPSEVQEDARHLHRELRTVKKERARLVNRIRGLLATQGVSAWSRSGGVRLESIRRWDGTPLPAGLRARIEREMERYRFVHRQVLELERENRKAIGQADSDQIGIRRLARLRAVGRVSATVFGREFGWRNFCNRRQVGSLSGLAPTPYQSGKSFREQGISRAGNRHVRGVAVELAWAWLRWQPGSELSRWYQRRFAEGGSRMRRIGIVGLARKLLIALWRYWAFEEIPKGALLKSV